MTRKYKSRSFMKILVSGRHTNTLQDIRAAVAAAEKTGSASKTPRRATTKDMKSGIARAVRRKYGSR
jgi:hypothetical protein